MECYSWVCGASLCGFNDNTDFSHNRTDYGRSCSDLFLLGVSAYYGEDDKF